MPGFITNIDSRLIQELPAGNEIIGLVGLDTSANTIKIDPANNTVTFGGYDGSILTTAVTVGTAAVALPASTLISRKTLFIQNNSNTTIYLGGSGVTTADGILVKKGDSFSIDIGSATLYAIAGSAGNEVRVMEIS